MNPDSSTRGVMVGECCAGGSPWRPVMGPHSFTRKVQDFKGGAQSLPHIILTINPRFAPPVAADSKTTGLRRFNSSGGSFRKEIGRFPELSTGLTLV